MQCIWIKGQELLLEGPEHKLILSGGRWKLEKNPRSQSAATIAAPNEMFSRSTANPVSSVNSSSVIVSFATFQRNQTTFREAKSIPTERASSIPCLSRTISYLLSIGARGLKNGYTREATRIGEEVGPAQLFENQIRFGCH